MPADLASRVQHGATSRDAVGQQGACGVEQRRTAEGRAYRDPLTGGFDVPSGRLYPYGSLARWPATAHQRVTGRGVEQSATLALWPLPATPDLSEDVGQIAWIGRPGRRAHPS